MTRKLGSHDCGQEAKSGGGVQGWTYIVAVNTSGVVKGPQFIDFTTAFTPAFRYKYFFDNLAESKRGSRAIILSIVHIF